MTKLAVAVLLGVMMLPTAAVRPAAAQTAVGCAPDCDFRHYYGAYDYTYERPGLFCYPVCGPDGSCVPAKTCVSSAVRGRVLVRSVSAPGAVSAPVAIAAPANPTTVTFYDPSLASPAPPPRAARRARVRR